MNTTPTIPGSFIIQSQGPDEPFFILGPDPQNRFIARMDEGTMEDAQLLAASRDLLQELRNIACANFKTWDEGMNNAEEFVKWAQSRARSAIDKATILPRPKHITIEERNKYTARLRCLHCTTSEGIALGYLGKFIEDAGKFIKEHRDCPPPKP